MSKAEAIYDAVRRMPETAQTAVLKTVQLMADTNGGSLPANAQSVPLALQFRQLVEVWRRETAFLSFMQQRAMHPAYQRIIGMGWIVVPLILRELERQPEHWLWALRAITGEEVSPAADTLPDAVVAWLRWGRERGLLPDAQG